MSKLKVYFNLNNGETDCALLSWAIYFFNQIIQI